MTQFEDSLKKEYINIVKKTLLNIKSKKFFEEYLISEISLNTTNAFLTRHEYFKACKKINNKEFRYTMLEGTWFEVENYKLLQDFFLEYTGSSIIKQETNDFETYREKTLDDIEDLFYDLLDENMKNCSLELKQVLNQLESVFNEEMDAEYLKAVESLNDPNAIILLPTFYYYMDYTYFNSIFDKNIRVISNKVIKKFKSFNFANMIDEYKVKTWDEINYLDSSIDIKMESQEQNITQFNELVRSWFEFSDITKLTEINSRNSYLVKKLQDWSKDKSYENLSLFGSYYPIDKKLLPFKWVDQASFIAKEKEYKKLDSMLNSISSLKGLNLDITPKESKSRIIINHILNIPGNKSILISFGENNSCIEFDIDYHNRVGNEINDYQELNHLIKQALREGGAIIIKQEVKQINLMQETNLSNQDLYSINIYGISLYNNSFEGLSKEKLKDSYDNNSRKILNFPMPSSVRYITLKIKG